MLKIILPIKNEWLNKYFNTQEAYNNEDISKINKMALEKVLKDSLGTIPEYQIEFEDRKYGQYFIIEDDKQIKWVSISADYTVGEKNGGSTNAYFVESIPMTLRASYEKQTHKNKKVELYLMGGFHNRATTQTQIMYYRMATTCGIKILNIKELKRSEKNLVKEIQSPFISIEEWKNQRIYNKTRNSSNNSSYILEQEDDYIFYGKTFGANGRESIFILYFLSKLAKKERKKVYLYEVAENGANALESSMNNDDKRFRKMLESLGIIYYVDVVDTEETQQNVKKPNEKEKNARNQAEFMKNLMIKFNAQRNENNEICKNKKGNPIIKDVLKKCYLCDCTIQKAIIASHIQRVTDINKLKIPFCEKRKKAVDGDNGFWLCGTHDKMFEYGIIIFDEQDGSLKMNIESLNEQQMQYIKEITKKMNISELHFNDNLKQYLEIHNKRIKKTIKNCCYFEIKE